MAAMPCKLHKHLKDAQDVALDNIKVWSARADFFTKTDKLMAVEVEWDKYYSLAAQMDTHVSTCDLCKSDMQAEV
jgi:hypothetical protein